MDLQLYDVTTGVVIEEWDAIANGMFTRRVVLNPAVGTSQFKIRARASSGSSGCAVVGASLVADQAKR